MTRRQVRLRSLLADISWDLLGRYAKPRMLSKYGARLINLLLLKALSCQFLKPD